MTQSGRRTPAIDRSGNWRGRPTRVAVAALVLAVLAVCTVGANVILLVPEDSQSGPFYARIERGAVYHDEDWAAIAFYRDPSCVRPDFNLLNFFDAGNIPAIFACPLTVHGFEVWKNGPEAGDPGPIQSRSSGNGAVPIWFVAWYELDAALADNRLTIVELQALPSLLQGSASFYRETLHPTGVARNGKFEVVASGELPDGRTFQFQASEAADRIRAVQIRFSE
jgi:hypothetical protein